MFIRTKPICAALFLAGLAPLTAQAFNVPLAADTYISPLNPSTNFGVSPNLRVGAGNTTFLNFDLNATLPAGVTASQVSRATLVFWTNTVTTAGALQISTVNTPWTETGVTLNTNPGTSALIATNIPVPRAANYAVVDITDQLKRWIAAPATNFGLAIEPDLAAPSTAVLIDSKESTGTSHAAYIDVTLTGPVGPTGPAGPGSQVFVGTATTPLANPHIVADTLTFTNTNAVTVNFGVPFTAAPFCTASNSGGTNAIGRINSATPTSVTVGLSVITSTTVSYICVGN